MSTSTIPTPTTKINLANREIEYIWESGHPFPDTECTTTETVLTVAHDKSGKQYRATLMRRGTDAARTRHVYLIAGGESVLIDRKATPRYSAKDFQAFAVGALEELERHLASDSDFAQRVREVFAGRNYRSGK